MRYFQPTTKMTEDQVKNLKMLMHRLHDLVTIVDTADFTKEAVCQDLRQTLYTIDQRYDGGQVFEALELSAEYGKLFILANNAKVELYMSLREKRQLRAIANGLMHAVSSTLVGDR